MKTNLKEKVIALFGRKKPDIQSTPPKALPASEAVAAPKPELEESNSGTAAPSSPDEEKKVYSGFPAKK